ncbi:DUF4230 domain-containing protein [Fredinandcohnia sp. 179-A 10B2 NHS]|uniref:DUF4230 domain-containing protein n=1 Tax=Fredinandcohnia sp. 179-A 10B2 NHS TaxID=3235176 RepID=UPI0039A09CEA
MNNNDDKIAELERLLKELKAGQEETSATAAVLERGGAPRVTKSVANPLLKFLGMKLLIPILLIALVAAAGIMFFTGSTFKKESTTFVEQVQELATLATAEAHLKEIITQEDNKLFGLDIPVDLLGTKRELLFVVPATVIAGVDLQGVTSESLIINEKEKEIKLTLPHAALLQEPSIKMDKIQAISDEGLFRLEVSWDEGNELVAEAQEKIKKEAIEIGLLQTAEKTAEKVLTEFFDSLGYTVEIAFK